MRIVQETLANVRKHAGASRVCVRLAETSEALEAMVEDNGPGFDLRRARSAANGIGPHFGLATMRERAESIGGTLEIASAPGQGTRVQVRIPVRTGAISNL